jgi:hypothetical protein
MKKIILSVIGVTLLVGASYITTTGCLRGGVPTGVIVLNVVSDNGTPITNAKLSGSGRESIINAKKHISPDFGSGKEYVSNAEGIIKFKSEGSIYGGTGWYFLWLIPLGSYNDAPEFDIVLVADGYSTRHMPFWDLYDNNYNTYEDFPKERREVNGLKTEYKIYENTYVLKELSNN